MMKYRDLNPQARMLVDLVKDAWNNAVAHNPALRNQDFHAAAVLASGHIHVTTTLQLGPGQKIPAILRAISELAREQEDHDRDIVCVAVYGAGPGEDPNIHLPCQDCMEMMKAYDSDKDLDIVVLNEGRLMLTKMTDHARP